MTASMEMTARPRSPEPVQKVRVAIRTQDPLTMAGIASCLGSRSDMVATPARQHTDADVVVVAPERLTNDVMALMRSIAEESEARIVLVTSDVDPGDLLTVIECRVVAVLPRQAATDDRLASTIKAAAAGEGVVPPDLLGELLRQVQSLQRDVLGPHGLSASGLSQREIEVLRLMAEGWNTEEIANKLSYSERTVKNIIYTMTNRLNLRNRPHAVAYALRAGMI